MSVLFRYEVRLHHFEEDAVRIKCLTSSSLLLLLLETGFTSLKIDNVSAC